MVASGRKRKRTGKPQHVKRAKTSDVENAEAEQLQALLEQGAPQSGTNLLHTAHEEGGYVGAKRFELLPLSKYMQHALKEHKFTQLTAIQRATLPHALCGRDILGAAKTGSGKTLCFLIPAIELLYRERWTQLDGLGALIISPTRELAMQIFADLRKVGKNHSISAGLLIGGKDVGEEQDHILRMNILIATPGRLLQHMDETPGFDCTNVRLVVLDEADRCMDMGFQATMDAIIQNLPRRRQTLLFSATQSKKVSDLARLSLQDPEFVAVHAESEHATPQRLKQWYVTCPLERKIDLLWFFIKTHQKQRTIVFLATCKQVKFVYEAFRKLRPGVPLGMLHGRLKQMKRMAVFYKFQESAAMVLFATDIAARGLDFPAVDWVLQADCAEDGDSYIHRVGRTARFKAAGESLAFLTPSEEAGMLAALQTKKVPLQQRRFANEKVTSLAPALTSLLAKSDELKTVAQAAFVSYVRSVFLHPDKGIFDVLQLDLEAFAESFGLPTMPRVRMVHKLQKQAGKAAAKQVGKAHKRAIAQPAADAAQTGADAATQGLLQDAGAAAESGGGDSESGDQPNPGISSDDDDAEGNRTREETDFMQLKAGTAAARQSEQPTESTDGLLQSARPSKKRKRLKINKDTAHGKKVLFDADGNALDPLAMLGEDDSMGEPPAERFSAIQARLRAADAADSASMRAQQREAKALRKAKRRAAKGDASADDMAVQLGAAPASDGSAGDSDGLDSDGSEKAPAARVSLRNGDAYAGMHSERDDSGVGKSSRATHKAHVPRAQEHDSSMGLPADLASQEALVRKLLDAR